MNAAEERAPPLHRLSAPRKAFPFRLSLPAVGPAGAEEPLGAR